MSGASGVVARLREIASSRKLILAEVKPPAGLLRLDGGAEQRAREAEEAAQQQLVELDGQRVRLRMELGDLQRRIEHVRRQYAVLADVATGRASSTCGVSSIGEASLIPGGSPALACNDSWCHAFVLEVAGSKFRCTLCSKLFRGPEFARRHVLSKHQEEATQIAEDQYFDCDVSNEESLPTHRSAK